jgi:hypothetical protein
MTVVAVLFVFVAFSFWYGTWYGRKLSDGEIEQQLSDKEHPRKVQHALSQIAEKIERGDKEVARWYPKIIALAGDPTPQIRMTAAWVMGQDNGSREFHDTLLGLLADSNPLVRRNTALALVRFHDSSGRPELGMMLRPYTLRAEREGTISLSLKDGESQSDKEETLGTGTLIGRIKEENGEVFEVRSPMPGYLKGTMVKDGQRVTIGNEIALISPEPKQVLDALRALYLIGEMDDLPDVELYTRSVPHMNNNIQQQAEFTAKAIRSRAESKVQQ